MQLFIANQARYRRCWNTVAWLQLTGLQKHRQRLIFIFTLQYGNCFIYQAVRSCGTSSGMAHKARKMKHQFCLHSWTTSKAAGIMEIGKIQVNQQLGKKAGGGKTVAKTGPVRSGQQQSTGYVLSPPYEKY